MKSELTSEASDIKTVRVAEARYHRSIPDRRDELEGALIRAAKPRAELSQKRTRIDRETERFDGTFGKSVGRARPCVERCGQGGGPEPVEVGRGDSTIGKTCDGLGALKVEEHSREIKDYRADWKGHTSVIVRLKSQLCERVK